MNITDVRVQQGDIYLIDGQKYAIFYVAADDIVGLIHMERIEFVKYDSNDFVQKIADGVIVLEPQEEEVGAPELPESELERVRELSRVMDDLITDQYPAWSQLTVTNRSHGNVFEAAEKVGITVKYFRKLLYRYLRHGRDMYSLVDNRRLAMVNKQKSKALTIKQSQVLDTKDVAYAYGLAVFKEKLSVQDGHDALVTKYYSTIKNVLDSTGALVPMVVPNDDAPAYDSFWRHVRKNLGGVSITDYIKGEREVRNNHRKLTGTQRSGLITIGQLMQLDECEVAVDLTDGYGHVIGKPVTYCAFDPAAQIIIGFYIGFINNSYDGVVNLFLSMMEPHENQTGPFNVHCTDYEFPSMVFPRQVYVDQGAEYMSGNMERAMHELGITVAPVPAAAGSYKGGVENVFHRLQSRLKLLLKNDGYILETHEGPEEARKNAVLTMDDFKEICYRLVIELNTSPLGEMFSPDLEMMENQIKPVPAEIWKFKRKTNFNPISITDKNRMQKAFCLLWRDKKFSVDRDGLRYKGGALRYYTNEEWFDDFMKEKPEKPDVRYHKADISKVFVRYKDIIHTVPLMLARDELHTFKGKTWDEYDALVAGYKRIKPGIEKEEQITRLTARYQNEQTVAVARAAHEGIKNDAKHIPEARKVEQIRLEASPDETKNRVLELEPIMLSVPDIVSVKKEVPVPETDELDEDFSIEALANLVKDEG